MSRHALKLRSLATALIGAIPLTLMAAPAAQAEHRPLRLIGEQTVPNSLIYDGTVVGGLSSIDYDFRTGEYALICDDRSALNPARYYTAKFSLDSSGLGPVTFTGTRPLLRPDGKTYPPLPQNDASLPQNMQTVDPEELRVDPWTGHYLWAQEGERSAAALIDPSIRETERDGSYVRDLPIPDNEKMTATTGPRQNLVLEGLTYAGFGSLVASSVEGPLTQDGPVPTTTEGGLSRITLQSRFGPVLAQYAYPQDKIFAAPNPPGAFSTTGVSSLLAVDQGDPTRYLVMERAFVTGVGNKIRIYEIDTNGATNIAKTPSLADAKKVKPVKKRLLADLADFKLSTVDNVEGMTWGPRLPNGERSLVLVSDNNFAATQVTQFIALAVPAERL